MDRKTNEEMIFEDKINTLWIKSLKKDGRERVFIGVETEMGLVGVSLDRSQVLNLKDGLATWLRKEDF